MVLISIYFELDILLRQINDLLNHRMSEAEKRIDEGLFDNKEKTNGNDKALEFRKQLDLFKSGIEFEQDIIEGVEEVRGGADLENDEFCLDTDETDIKKLINGKEYLESIGNCSYTKNRKESRETLDLRYNCERKYDSMQYFSNSAINDINLITNFILLSFGVDQLENEEAHISLTTASFATPGKSYILLNDNRTPKLDNVMEK